MKKYLLMAIKKFELSLLNSVLDFFEKVKKKHNKINFNNLQTK